MDVNAAPNAVSFYQKMGFVPTSEEQETDGIRFIPMRKNLSE
jgi:predicted GNAT family N-acyltransferase